MSNSNIAESKIANLRPHRRLSLTQPTQRPATALPAEEAASPLQTLEPQPEVTTEVTPTVRVMAYLSTEEARVLDETWLKLRSHPARPSKSDILRAACALATQDFETLTKILSEQQVSTLSRQRSSKIRKS